MALLDACTTFCTSLSEALGPTFTELLGFAGVIALGWWKAHRVQKAAAVGIAAASEQASKAKAEARTAQVQLAEIRGSLRPVAIAGGLPSLPPLEPPPASSSSSGNWNPVTMPELGAGTPRPVPSMADPSIVTVDAPLPRPSRLPDWEPPR